MMNGSESMKLSIIVPVYNIERYLKDCLDSIQSQSFTDYELLLIDDGSTDRSPEICDRYAEKDARVHVIHSQNAGVSNARNLGIEAAKGEYIGFIDGDDVLAGKDALWDMMCLTEDAGVDMIAARSDEFYDGKRIEDLCGGRSDSRYRTADSGEVRRFVSGTYMMANLFSRRAIGNIRFDKRIKLGEDILFLLQVISNSKKTIIYERIYYHRRIRPESASHTAGIKPEMMEENDLVFRLLHQELNGKPGGDELYEKYDVDQTSMINRLMPAYKEYRKEARIFQKRIRSAFPHFLKNPLIKPQTKTLLVLYMISPDLFYICFRPYKRLKQIMVRVSI